MTNGFPTGHTRFIVSCVTILGVLCIAAGTVLIFKGYHADLLIGGAISAISGLLGMLTTRPVPPPDVTISGQPPKVELTSTPKPTP